MISRKLSGKYFGVRLLLVYLKAYAEIFFFVDQFKTKQDRFETCFGDGEMENEEGSER